MPRTFEQAVQEAIGGHTFTICQLRMDLEAAQERIAALEQENAKLRATLNPYGGA